MNRKLILIVCLLAVAAAVGAVYILGSRKKPTPPPPVPVGVTPSASPTISPNPGERSTQLKPVGNFSGDGLAVRSVSPNSFRVRVKGTLPEPAEGKFYEVYLARSDPSAQFSIGRLKKEGEDWTLTLTQTRDASAYLTVFVSLESTDDKKPEQRVLEGSF